MQREPLCDAGGNCKNKELEKKLPANLSITDLIGITDPNNSWKQFFRYGDALPISK